MSISSSIRLALLATCFSMQAIHSAQAQSFRTIGRVNTGNLSLPGQTITSVTIETTAAGGLREVTTSLTKQNISIPQTPNTSSVVSTYAGTAVKEVTLFDPTSFSNSNPGTTETGQGPAYTSPNNCGALTRSNGNPATYSYPVVPGTLPAQNPLGGDYWLGSNPDTQNNPVNRTDTSASAGTGFGISAYTCPLTP